MTLETPPRNQYNKIIASKKNTTQHRDTTHDVHVPPLRNYDDWPPHYCGQLCAITCYNMLFCDLVVFVSARAWNYTTVLNGRSLSRNVFAIGARIFIKPRIFIPHRCATTRTHFVQHRGIVQFVQRWSLSASNRQYVTVIVHPRQGFSRHMPKTATIARICVEQFLLVFIVGRRTRRRIVRQALEFRL